MPENTRKNRRQRSDRRSRARKAKKTPTKMIGARLNAAAIERLITQLSHDLHVTSLLVTHDIEGGLEMCDRVAMLEGGHLRFCGSPEEFRKSSDPVVSAFMDRKAAYAALDTLEIG